MKMHSWKVALITGATTRIGKACAEYLAQQNYTVYGTCSRLEEGDMDLPYRLLEMKITHPESVEDLVDQVIEMEGKIDVLINIPDACIAGSIEETTLSEAYWQFEQHFFSALRMSKVVLPYMRTAGKGMILNMNSVAGRIGLPYQGVYSAAGFALEGMSEALRLEVRPYNIRVVLMEAGGIVPDFTSGRVTARLLQNRSGYMRQFKQTMNIVSQDAQRNISPEQVAQKVFRVLETKSPKMRYTSLGYVQKWWLTLKAFLPYGWLERILSEHYQLGLFEQKPKAAHVYKN